MGMGERLLAAWGRRPALTPTPPVVAPSEVDLGSRPPDDPPAPDGETLAAIELSRELIRGIEHFVLTTPDLDAPSFLDDLRTSGCRLGEDSDTTELHQQRDWAVTDVARYGQRQRSYLAEREDELWKLLALYQENQRIESSANRQFHDVLRNFHERLSHVSRLSDIRQVRDRLEAEINRATGLVEKKLQQDQERAARLRQHVAQLEAALASAQQQLLKDPLTGVYHRAGFEAQLMAALAGPVPFALAIADVDNFKDVNDSLGHLAGDEVLKQAVHLLGRTTRPGEILGRYGGDEFMILVPGATANRVADRFAAAAGTRIVGFWHNEEEISVRLSFSIGVTDSRPGDTAESIFRRADQALYQAKRGGKGKAVVGCEPEPVN